MTIWFATNVYYSHSYYYYIIIIVVIIIIITKQRKWADQPEVVLVTSDNDGVRHATFHQWKDDYSVDWTIVTSRSHTQLHSTWSHCIHTLSSHVLFNCHYIYYSDSEELSCVETIQVRQTLAWTQLAMWNEVQIFELRF